MIDKLRRKGEDMRERIYFNNNWKFAECFADEMCLVFSDTAVLRHANVLDAVAALIASICLAVCKLSNDTSQVVEAAQGSVLGLRFTMTVIPIIGLVATFFIFRKRYILTEEKVEEIAAQVKMKREREAS